MKNELYESIEQTMNENWNPGTSKNIYYSLLCSAGKNCCLVEILLEQLKTELEEDEFVEYINKENPSLLLTSNLRFINLDELV